MTKRSTPAPKKPSWPDSVRPVVAYMNLGWSLVAAVLLGILVGRWADARLGTEPWLFIIGAVLGIGIGLYYFLETILRK